MTITRYAVFEGVIKNGDVAGFRAAILEKVLPIWKQFPGASEVRVTFSDARDEGAPEYPLILAITYPDLEAMSRALDSAPRAESRRATEEVTAEFFVGRIHHHVTTTHVHPLSGA